jgi:hypothetical protein
MIVNSKDINCDLKENCGVADIPVYFMGKVFTHYTLYCLINQTVDNAFSIMKCVVFLRQIAAEANMLAI